MEPNGTERIFRRSERRYDTQGSWVMVTASHMQGYKMWNLQSLMLTLPSTSAAAMCKREWGGTWWTKFLSSKQKPFLHNGKITKGIGGRRGLTPKAIKKIHGHYWAAIRKNVNNIDQMRKDMGNLGTSYQKTRQLRKMVSCKEEPTWWSWQKRFASSCYGSDQTCFWDTH